MVRVRDRVRLGFRLGLGFISVQFSSVQSLSYV